MAAAQDIIFKPGTGLVIENGDFRVSASDNQGVELTLICEPGNLRWRTDLGVGIQGEINGPYDLQFIRQKIRRELAKDGYAATLIQFRDGGIEVQGQRQSNNPK